MPTHIVYKGRQVWCQYWLKSKSQYRLTVSGPSKPSKPRTINYKEI